MSDLIDSNQLEEFANYSEKHSLFDLFSDAVSKLIIARPADPYGFLIDYFTKPREKFIIVITPPLSDVSSVLESVVKEMDLVHVKTSDILEKAYEKQSSAGVQARPYVERGILVPDALITAMVLQRIRESDVIEKGVILEGFPKTKEQAWSLLRAGFIPDHVIDIDIPDSKIIASQSLTRFDPTTQKIYNITTDMATKNPIIGARLIHKVPEESIRQRLKIFRNNYKDIIDCFPNQSARFSLENDSEDMNHRMLNDIHVFLGTRPKSNSPRGFKIIVSGFPGSGKSTISDYIGEKFGAIVVSPKSAMLQAVSAGEGQEFLPFLEKPHLVPEILLRELIAKRLKEEDCKNNGWVLDGFPMNYKDVEFLQKQNLVPNRVIWLNTDVLTCRERLLKRRYDPYSSRCVNLANIPAELQNEKLDTWIRAPNDFDDIVKQRFQFFESTEKTLKKLYGLRTEANETGVMHYLDNDGIGESVGDEPTLPLKKVFEVIEAYLLRPVPFSIKNFQ